MAKNIEIELNLKGLNELMRSEEIQNILDQAGEAVATAAGVGFGHRTDVIRWIAVTNVYPATTEAYRKNMKENSLLAAVGKVGLNTRK
jgi:urease alpha subunit